MLHVDINELHVDIILLHVDIHCNLLYLACRRQSYATTVVNTKIKRKKIPFTEVWYRIMANAS